MPAPTRYRINLTSMERAELERLARGHTSPQHIARRARIILMANEEGMSNQEIATRLGTTKAKVTQWTKGWIERALEPVRARFSDLPRPGAPETITAEQWCRILALARESPRDYGHPITHWSSRELAAEAVRQGIVEHLSAGHLRRVLEEKRCSPTEAVTGSTPSPMSARTNASPTSAASISRRPTAATSWS